MEDRIMKWTNLEKVLTDYAIELRNKYQDNLINNDRIATGDLLNSCEYIIEKDNIQISVSLKLQDYWKYVEYDTKPHWPPVDKIMDWIKVKPVLPRPDKNGKLPTPQQLAYLIGKKISEEGTKGSNDLHSAVEEINTKYEQLIETAILKDVDEMATVVFTQFFRE